MTLADKLNERRAARHAKACAAGKHKWVLVSEECFDYSYSSTGGAGLTRTERIYECAWCGERDYTAEGDDYEWQLHVDAYGDAD